MIDAENKKLDKILINYKVDIYSFGKIIEFTDELKLNLSKEEWNLKNDLSKNMTLPDPN